MRDSSGTTRPLPSRRRENTLLKTPAWIDEGLPALGIRQPWAELILRGRKTIEVRAVPTNIRGPIYVYASKTAGVGGVVERAASQHDLDIDALPRGVLIATVDLVDCRPCRPADSYAACVPPAILRDCFGWVLSNPRPLQEPVEPRFLPFGIWFYPFVRRNEATR